MNEYNNFNGNSGDPYSSGVYRQNPAESLAATASVMGTLAVVSSFFMPIVVPSILGGMAVILAVISKGRNEHFSRTAKRAVITGCVALALHAAALSVVGISSYKMLTDPALREQANQITEQVYGYTFDDMLKILDDDLGTDLYEMDGSKRPENDATPIIPGLNDTDTLPAE